MVRCRIPISGCRWPMRTRSSSMDPTAAFCGFWPNIRSRCRSSVARESRTPSCSLARPASTAARAPRRPCRRCARRALILLHLRSISARRAHLLQGRLGALAAVEAGRAKEHDGVLDSLATELRQRLLIFGQNPQNAAVGSIEELLVLIGQRHPLIGMRQRTIFVFFGHQNIAVT